MDINSLIKFISTKLSEQPIIESLNNMILHRLSSAGTRREEVFTREFLCPAISDYFYNIIRNSLNLSDDEIMSGLGTEGYINAKGFGFTPARQKCHFFTKSDIVKSTIPDSWTNGHHRRNQACPDFAIRAPLPFSTIGEVKFFHSGGQKSALKELYNVARQAVFYLGAYACEYDSALIVVADASKGHVFHNAIKQVNPEIINRFGDETSIYLSVIALH